MQKILITGGNFINKGAQSMLFCLVDGLKNKFPQAEIVMIDLFPTILDKDKANYSFKIVNMHIRTLLRMAFPFLKLLVKPKPISNAESEIKNHFKTANLVLDISGYGVSSHNQKPLWTYATLFPVRYAKRFKVPFIFLPQSIGPFEFSGWKKLVIWPLIKKYLKYPETIFIREPNCREHLNKLKTKQVIDSFDLVLQSSKINSQNIFCSNSSQSPKNYDIKKDAVVIIPNKQLTRIISEEETVKIFSSAINTLIIQNQHVSIVRHSADDKEICDLIFEAAKHENVQLINEDLSPLEIQEIFDASKMVIAARYHGLIHALKLSKPCVVIGWANKYNHVMNTFDLTQFYFDINSIDKQKVTTAIETMLNELPLYKSKIAETLTEIKSSDIFKHIK